MAQETSLAYEELIKEQLTEERGRKDSLERRALAVVTSSGTMATLLIAVATLVLGSEIESIPGASRGLFSAAVVSFTLAGVFGIFTNGPAKYEEPSVGWLRKLAWPSVWDGGDASLARRRTTEARLESIESFRRSNKKKVDLLTYAIVSEVAAVGLVAVGVILAFNS